LADVESLEWADGDAPEAIGGSERAVCLRRKAGILGGQEIQVELVARCRADGRVLDQAARGSLRADEGY
jgi:hypothetical protein